MPTTKSTDGDLNLQPTMSCLSGYQEHKIKLPTALNPSKKLLHEINHSENHSEYYASRHEALLQMQKTDPFCKCISEWLSSGKHPEHSRFIYTHKGTTVHNMSWMPIRNLWHSSYQKFGSIQYKWKHMTHSDTKEWLAHAVSSNDNIIGREWTRISTNI